MATRTDRFNILNVRQTQLDGAIDNSQTNIAVTAGTGSLWAPSPTIITVADTRQYTDMLTSERMLVTADAGVDDTWTVERGYDNSTPQSFADDAFVFGLSTAAIYDQLWNHVALLEQLLFRQFGNLNKVAMTDNTGGFNDLKVTQDTGSNMKFKVATGYCWIDYEPMGLSAVFTSALLVAPVTNPRIDLVQGTLAGNTITVKTGVEAGSPVAPTVDAGSIALAEIALAVGHTQIIDANITSVRVF
jgi:hypothetical protein